MFCSCNHLERKNCDAPQSIPGNRQARACLLAAAFPLHAWLACVLVHGSGSLVAAAPTSLCLACLPERRRRDVCQRVGQCWAGQRAGGEEQGAVGAAHSRGPRSKRGVAPAAVVQHAEGKPRDEDAAPAGGGQHADDAQSGPQPRPLRGVLAAWQGHTLLPAGRWRHPQTERARPPLSLTHHPGHQPPG